MSLKKQAVSGIFWTSLQQAGGQIINFVISVILARILLPEHFGRVALLGVFIAIGNTIIDAGMNQSLIRKKNPDIKDYTSVFYANFIFSILLYVILYFSAPLISKFYNQPLLTALLRVYGLVLFINALVFVQNVKLTIALNFRKQLLISLPSIILSGIVGIVMAWQGFNEWSLIGVAISRVTFLAIQLWIYDPWRPSVKYFDKNVLKHHLEYGVKIAISGIIDTFFQEIYALVIGKFFNISQLGYFNRANQLRQLPERNISGALGKVTFPLLSKIKDNRDRLKSAYKRILKISTFIVSPVLLLMAALADPLFRWLYSDKWLPAVPYFQILSVAGIFRIVNSFNINILMLKGSGNQFLWVSILKKIALVIVILALLPMGIYGLIWAVVIQSFIATWINAYYSQKFLNYNVLQQFGDMFPIVLNALFASVIVWYVDSNYMGHLNNFLRIIAGITLGGGIYLVTSIIFFFDLCLEIKDIMRGMSEKLKFY